MQHIKFILITTLVLLAIPLFVEAKTIDLEYTFTEDTTILLENTPITSLTITGNHTGNSSEIYLVTNESRKRVLGVLGTIEFEEVCTQTCDFEQETAQYLEVGVDGGLYIDSINLQTTQPIDENVDAEETIESNTSIQIQEELITIQSTTNISSCSDLESIPSGATGTYVLTQDIDCSSTQTSNTQTTFSSTYIGSGELTTYKTPFDDISYMEVYFDTFNRTANATINYTTGTVTFTDTPDNLFGSGVLLEARDIELNTGHPTGFTPISSFQGILDGNGYVVSNLHSHQLYSGSAGFINLNGGTLRNIGFENVSFWGNIYVGLVPRMSGSIVEQVYVTGDITGFNSVAGIVGSDDSCTDNILIKDSYARVNINGSYSAAPILGSSCSGGIVERVYSASTLGPGSIFELAPSLTTVRDGFYDSTLAGGSGIEAKTTTQLKNVSTYTDTATSGLTSSWDFESNPNDDTAISDIWGINSSLNDGYPILTTIQGFTTYEVITVLNTKNDTRYYTDNPVLSCISSPRNTNVTNVSLYTDYGGWSSKDTVSLSGSDNVITNFSYSVPLENTVTWNCFSCSSTEGCSFAQQNFTFSTVNYTISNFSPNTSSLLAVTTGQNTSLNFSIFRNGVLVNDSVTLNSVHIGERSASFTGGFADTLRFNDTFTGTDGTALTSHTPDKGAGWTQLFSLGSTAEINSNTLTGSKYPSSASGDKFAVVTPEIITDDYNVTATISGINVGDGFGLYARVIDDENYYLALYDAWGDDLHIIRNEAGTFTSLDSASHSVSSGSKIVFEVKGNSLSLYDDGSLIVSTTDSTFSSAGFAGAGLGDPSDTATVDRIDDQQIDDFSVTIPTTILGIEQNDTMYQAIFAIPASSTPGLQNTIINLSLGNDTIIQEVENAYHIAPETISSFIKPYPYVSSSTDLTGYCKVNAGADNSVTINYTWYRNDSVYSTGSYTDSVQNTVDVNVSTLSDGITSVNDNWIFSCQAITDTQPGELVNSTTTQIVTQAPEPRFTNSTPTERSIIQSNPINISVESLTPMQQCTFNYTYFNQSYKTTFNYTGSVQTFNPKPGIHSIDLYGAEGGQTGSSAAGLGGRVQGSLLALPGETFDIYVGGAGARNDIDNSGGYNGGGTDGSTSSSHATGGGATDIRPTQGSLINRILVAGGGGAGHGSFSTGGDGGGLTGGDGESNGGTGGNQTSVGTGHIDGSFGQGGNSRIGGGGGYYGGGGGFNRGGGGGSSYYGGTTTYSVSNTSTTSGLRSGNGTAIITGPKEQTTSIVVTAVNDSGTYRASYTGIPTAEYPSTVTVTCEDASNITGSTLPREFRYSDELPDMDTFDASTTTIAHTDYLFDMKDFTLEKSAYAKIVWNDNIDVRNQNFDTNIEMGNNFVYVNSTALDGSINSSANITLYGNFKSEIFRDGIACNSGTTPACNIYENNGAHIIFDVEYFSNYSVTKSQEPIATNFDGRTTNFSAETNLSAVQLILEKTAYAKITWNSNIDVTQEDYDQNVLMGDNWVFVNSSNLHSSHNSSANITIYGNFSSPVIFKDGTECSDCSILNTNSTETTFNTTSFSNHSIPISAPNCTGWWSGRSHPYQVTNLSDLQCMKVNLSADYELANNIDASDTITWNNGSGFETIGNASDGYLGTFDGQNYNITGLYIYRPGIPDQALFGFTGVETSTNLRNVGLRDFNITGASPTGTLIGNFDGGIVENVHATGSVTGFLNASEDVKSIGGLVGILYNGRTIRDSSADVTVSVENPGSGGAEFTGGLVGLIRSSSSIINSSAHGSVTGDVRVGGLAGHIESGFGDSKIEDSYATGNVLGTSEVGGLVGWSSGMIIRSYATGDVNATTSQAGGLVGDARAAGQGSQWENLQILDSYASGSVYSGDQAGALIGYIWCTGSSVTCIINSTYAVGAVSSDGSNAGGFIGFVSGSLSGTVNNSFWDNQTTGQSTSANGLATGKTTQNLKQISTYNDTSTTGLNSAWDIATNTDYTSQVWKIYPNQTYPRLNFESLVEFEFLGPENESEFTPNELANESFTVNVIGISRDLQNVSFTIDESIITTNTSGVSGAYSFNTTLENGNYSWGIIAYDTSGIRWESDPRTIYVNPTRLESVRVEPSPTVNATQDILGYCTATSDNSSLTYNYEWYKDEVLYSNGTAVLDSDQEVNVANISSSSTSVGEVWYLRCQSSVDGYQSDWLSSSTTTVTTTVIDSCQDLQNMDLQLSVEYQLISDIDCSVTTSWNSGAGFEPVGNQTRPFEGSLQGGGFFVRNLFINRSSTNYQGLFGAVNGSGQIANLSLENISIEGASYVGSLAGENLGLDIYNVHITGNVTGDDYVGGFVGDSSTDLTTYNNISFAGITRGSDFVGGIFGLSDDVTMTVATSIGTVVGLQSVGGVVGSSRGGDRFSSIVSKANVTGSTEVGGLGGYVQGRVSDSYSSGTIQGNSSGSAVGGLIGLYISFSYSVSDVHSISPTSNVGSGSAGGLLGDRIFGSVFTSYWDTQVTGQSSSVGGTGKNTSEMQDINTFLPEWNISTYQNVSSTIWKIGDGYTYPRLWFEEQPPNTPPIHDTPILNSTNGRNTSLENLTAYAMSVSDYQGDNISLNFDWRINGTSMALLNMPFNVNVSNNEKEAIKDYSTHAKNGTLGNGTAGTQPLWTSECVSGGCYEFDGTSDIIIVENLTELNNATEMTVCSWVYLRNADALGAVVLREEETNADGWAMQLGTTNDRALFSTADFDYGQTDSGALSANTWEHWCFVYNGSGASNEDKVQFYLNATTRNLTFTGTIASQLPTINANLTIGARGAPNVDPDRYLDGVIDEVLVLNRSLSPEQIQQIYDEGNASLNINPTNTSTIVSQETTIGENWSVAVTPSDQYADGITRVTNVLSIVDSCVYPGFGNWFISMGEYCVLDTPTAVNGSIVLEDAGQVTVNASINASSLSNVTTDQTVIVGSNARLNLLTS